MEAKNRQDLEKEKLNYISDNIDRYREGLFYKYKEVNNDTRKPARPR